MVNISEETAREIARSEIGLPPGTAGGAWLVHRLDEPDEHYWLVALGVETSETAVAAVDATDGSLMSWANIGLLGRFSLLPPQEAAALTGQPGAQAIRLVWRPCRASYSPLYPLWEVQTAETTVYVNQQGQVWQELVSGRA